MTSLVLLVLHTLLLRLIQKLLVMSSEDIITTKTSHGLQIGDDFRLKFTGTTTDSYKIKLDTINRKVLVDDISFADSKVDLTTNSIDISGYSKYKKLKTGDKVVYYANSNHRTIQWKNILYSERLHR